MKIRPRQYAILLLSVTMLIFSCNQNKSISESTTETEKSNVSEGSENNTTPVQDEPFDLGQYGIKSDSFIPTGKKVGERAPGFSGTDESGKMINSSDLLKKGPVVLQFYRGEWCPVCKRYYAAKLDSLPMIDEMGASFIGVSPEKSSYARKFKEDTKINFSIIHDEDYKIMKDYDVLFEVTDDYDEKIKNKLNSDIAEYNNDDDAFLPVPATYVIDQSGKIIYVQFNYDYKKRASIKSILKALNETDG